MIIESEQIKSREVIRYESYLTQKIAEILILSQYESWVEDGYSLAAEEESTKYERAIKFFTGEEIAPGQECTSKKFGSVIQRQVAMIMRLLGSDDSKGKLPDSKENEDV